MAALVAACTAMVMVVVGMPAASAAAGYVVTGRLVSDDGKPLAGLKVRAVPAAGYGSVGSSKTVTTNAKGDFRLPMPKAGSRFLLEAFDPARTATADTWGDCVEPARTKVLTTFIGSRGKQTFTDLDPITGYKARKSSHIRSGTHRLSASSGFDVKVEGATSDAFPSVEIIREDGTYASTSNCGDLSHGFIPGRYTIEVSAYRFETKRIRTTLERGEVEKHTVVLDDVPAARVTGTLTIEGKPVPDALVVATDGDDRWFSATDANGAYDIHTYWNPTDAMPADEPLSVTVQSTNDARFAGLGRTKIVLKDGVTTQLDISDAPTADRGVVRGRFVRTGRPSSGTAELRTLSGALVASVELGNRDVFLIGAPAGTYRLAYVDPQGDRFSYTTVRVAAGTTTQLGNVKVTRKTAKIYGKVPRGFTVVVRALDGKSHTPTWGDVVRDRYSIEDLIPGRYTIEYARSGYVSKNISVNVRTTKRQDAPRLQKAGRVQGTIVYKANGKRVPDDAMVHVEMTSKRTGRVGERGIKDHDSSFSVKHRYATAGKYALKLMAPRDTARCGVWIEESVSKTCSPVEGINSWRSPYYWDGRKIFRLTGGTNNVGKVQVVMRGGL